MKYIVIIPDGMFDNPIEQLGQKTPLEAARKANMDYMAQNGFTGLVQTIPDKMKPGSDIGNMAILGYDPSKYHTGRAPLEAANQNIILGQDEVAFRCNLVTIVDEQMADYSAGHISTKEAAVLIETLNRQLGSKEIRFIAGKSYRHLLILKVDDPKKYMGIKTTPPHDISGKKMKSFLPQGETADILLNLMEQSKAIFQNHTINQVR